MTARALLADEEATRVCRARVLDLLRQGWTARALAAGGGVDATTLSRVVQGFPVTWGTADRVADVFAALDGSLRRYQDKVNRRHGARTQALNRQAALAQMDRVRAGYRWGASVDALAAEYEMAPERVRLIVGETPPPRPSPLLPRRESWADARRTA